MAFDVQLPFATVLKSLDTAGLAFRHTMDMFLYEPEVKNDNKERSKTI